MSGYLVKLVLPGGGHSEIRVPRPPLFKDLRQLLMDELKIEASATVKIYELTDGIEILLVNDQDVDLMFEMSQLPRLMVKSLSPSLLPSLSLSLSSSSVSSSAPSSVPASSVSFTKRECKEAKQVKKAVLILEPSASPSPSSLCVFSDGHSDLLLPVRNASSAAFRPPLQEPLLFPLTRAVPRPLQKSIPGVSSALLMNNHQKWAAARDCRFFAFGSASCRNGDRCVFRHDLKPSPLRPSLSEMVCEVCELQCTSMKQFQDHREGKKHLHRVAVRNLFLQFARLWNGSSGCTNCGNPHHKFQDCSFFCRLWEIKQCPLRDQCPLQHIAL